MKSTTENIGEVFLFAWEKGLRMDIDHIKNLMDCYHDLSDEELLEVGWDNRIPPEEEDDIEFLSQYIQFRRIYVTTKA